MTSDDPASLPAKPWLDTAIWLGPLAVLLTLVATGFLTEDNSGVPVEVWHQGEVMTTLRGDFPSHFRFARAVLDGSLTRGFSETNRSVYTPASHRLMMQQWTSEDVGLALPFGYSPTCIWLMAPLMPLPPVWAFALWTALGISVSLWVVSRDSVPPFVAALVLLSPLTVWILRYGQTALLSLGGLAYLYLSLNSHRATRTVPPSGADRAWWTLLSQSLVLWALTAKPPLAVVAGVALLAERQVRPVVLGVLLTLLSTLALTRWLGPDWVGDYLRLLRSYNVEQADPTFAWCLQPTYLSNLRAVLYLDAGLPDAVASQVSAVSWGLALLGVLLAGWWGRWHRSLVWSLSILSYLLFSPHVNSSEDVQLLLLVVAGVSILPGSSFLSALLVAAAIWLSPGNTPSPTWKFPPIVEVMAKVALVAAILWSRYHPPVLLRPVREEGESRANDPGAP